jgi:ankyrin repeat protein
VHVTQCLFSKPMQDEDGNTPLIKACRYGDVETARFLLDHGANVDQQVTEHDILKTFWLDNNNT